MTTSAAVPEDLREYSGRATELDREMADNVRQLHVALDAFRATHPEFGRVSDIDGRLSRLVHEMGELDAWVGKVGHAFEDADRRHDGHHVVRADDKAISGRLHPHHRHPTEIGGGQERGSLASRLPREGDRPYVPPKAKGGRWDPKWSKEDKGFVDRDGNVWKWDRSGHGREGHWDVEHPDGKHTNVDVNGKVIHGGDNFPNRARQPKPQTQTPFSPPSSEEILRDLHSRPAAGHSPDIWDVLGGFADLLDELRRWTEQLRPPPLPGQSPAPFPASEPVPIPVVP